MTRARQTGPNLFLISTFLFLTSSLPADPNSKGAHQETGENRAKLKSPLPDSSGRRPSLRATRVNQAPVIDGKLDEPEWQGAPVGGSLIQYEPAQHVPMSQRTEFRILYDEKFIYLGVWCYDSEPDKIVARLMERDGPLWLDDNIIFVFDTFRDLRNGYVFFVNPNGARRDGLVIDNVKENHDWRGAWVAQARIDEEGWKVEVAIPLMTLAFDPDISTWGFNLQRTIQRTSEEGRWSGAEPQFRTGNVSEAGTVTGLNKLEQGRGIDFKPYVLSRGRNLRDGTGSSFESEFGGDLEYRLTPNLSATLSVNTDFAQTEVDFRQVNFTRFPLFFPEKRDFFLEDSNIYNFGGLTSAEIIPFFSRRIGLSNAGNVVPLNIAGKLAGRVGDYNMGFINASLGDQEGLGQKNVFVGRVTRNVLEQSSVGFLTTVGDPNSTDANFLLGSDARFRTTSFLGDKALQANLFILGTRTANQDGAAISPAYGFNIAYPNDLFNFGIRFYEIGRDFNPSLGFVPRKDVRAYSSFWIYQPRPDSIDRVRQFGLAYDNKFFTDLSNNMETSLHRITPFINFTNSSQLYFAASREFDAPNVGFEVGEGVIIPPENYRWNSYKTGLRLAQRRTINGSLSITQGEFYDGNRQVYSADLNFLPWKHLNLGFIYDYNIVDLPQGSFTTHLTSMRTGWYFTPDLFIIHLIQYDSISNSVGYNGRFQWEFRPGSLLYLVYNQAFESQNNSLVLRESEGIFKLGMSVRF